MNNLKNYPNGYYWARMNNGPEEIVQIINGEIFDFYSSIWMKDFEILYRVEYKEEE